MNHFPQAIADVMAHLPGDAEQIHAIVMRKVFTTALLKVRLIVLKNALFVLTVILINDCSFLIARMHSGAL
jgi:hypothetical protein